MYCGILFIKKGLYMSLYRFGLLIQSNSSALKLLSKHKKYLKFIV